MAEDCPRIGGCCLTASGSRVRLDLPVAQRKVNEKTGQHTLARRDELNRKQVQLFYKAIITLNAAERVGYFRGVYCPLGTICCWPVQPVFVIGVWLGAIWNCPPWFT